MDIVPEWPEATQYASLLPGYACCRERLSPRRGISTSAPQPGSQQDLREKPRRPVTSTLCTIKRAMFAQVKSVVDLIRSGVTDFRNFESDKERSHAVLDLLRVYFTLKDCVDDGEKLVAEAEPDPVKKISSMDPDNAIATLERWDATIRKQGIRLYQLQGAIFGQDHLTVINPELQERVSEVIGYKMDRSVTLHGIGSALFFRAAFPTENTSEEKARYIAVMAGEEDDSLNMPRIREEITMLRDSLNQYRLVVERLVSDAELLQLSHRARNETRFEDRA